MTPELLDRLSSLARASGSRVYLVGGFVRDLLLEREPVDLDLLVEGDPSPFLSALSGIAGHAPVVFSRHEPVTHRLALNDWLVDVSSFPPGGLAGELSRRDMTLNALALPLENPEGPVIDPLGGLADLRERRIRHVSLQGLEDDPLRLLRAVRLSVVLEGFAIDPTLRDAIRSRAGQIGRVAAERVLAEMEVILASPRAGQGIRLMRDVGLLGALFPEILRLDGLKQNRWHRHDALEHTLRAIEEVDAMQAAPDTLPEGTRLADDDGELLRWAALWHDAGKADTATRDERGEVHFLGHESVSAALCRAALSRLRMGDRKAGRVVTLVAHHLRLTLLSTQPQASDRALRRLVHEVSYDTPLLCLLSLADRRAGGGPAFEERLARLEALVGRVMQLFSAESDRIISPQALLTGHEVMALLGIGPGPRVGSVLRWLTRLQVEGRVGTRDAALELVRTLPPARLLTLDDDP